MASDSPQNWLGVDRCPAETEGMTGAIGLNGRGDDRAHRWPGMFLRSEGPP